MNTSPTVHVPARIDPADLHLPPTQPIELTGLIREQAGQPAFVERVVVTPAGEVVPSLRTGTAD